MQHFSIHDFDLNEYDSDDVYNAGILRATTISPAFASSYSEVIRPPVMYCKPIDMVSSRQFKQTFKKVSLNITLSSQTLAKLIIASDINCAMQLALPKSKFNAKRRGKGNDISIRPKELQSVLANVIEAHNNGNGKVPCKEFNDITKWIRNYLDVGLDHLVAVQDKVDELLDMCLKGENLDDHYKRELEKEQQEIKRRKYGFYYWLHMDIDEDTYTNNNKKSKLEKLPNDRARDRHKAATRAFQSKIYAIQNRHCQDSLQSNHVWVQQVMTVLRMAKRYYWYKLELPSRWLKTAPLFGNSSNFNSSEAEKLIAAVIHGNLNPICVSNILDRSSRIPSWNAFGKLCDTTIVCTV